MSEADSEARLVRFLERCLHASGSFSGMKFDDFAARLPGSAAMCRRQAEKIVSESRRVGVRFVFPGDPG